MRSSKRQYEFVDGHWHDVLNNLVDTTPLVDPTYPGCQAEWPEAILEMCACYDPLIIVDAMAEYLRRCIAQFADDAYPPALRYDTEHKLADYLLALMADDLGFTEHGGSVLGAWIEPAGLRWLELYDGTAG